MQMRTIVGFSGGKDSTALALITDAKYLLYTPTGNEPKPVAEHIERIRRLLGAELICPTAPTLSDLIYEFKALPNWRMRWCTRMIKVQPTMAWIQKNADFKLAVGIRADEQSRGGIYGLEPDRYCMPLQEMGWGLYEVNAYLEAREIEIPKRTDCAVCPYQRLIEWYWLWRDFPDDYTQGEAWEAWTGHTFRSESKDKHPTSLASLRTAFESGWIPNYRKTRERTCRICSM